MKWLLLWTGIGLLQVAVLAGCGWVLWRKGKALYQELRSQVRTLGEMTTLLGELELQGGRSSDPSRDAR